MDSTADLSQTEMLRVLNNIPMFAGIGFSELHLMASKCQISHHDEDEIIIEQGEVGDCLYAIVKGTVLVAKKNDSRGWVPVNTLGPGDVFGEIALLRNIPRTARIITQTACTFLVIHAKDFLELYQNFPPKSRDNIQFVVAKRLEQLKRIP